MTVARQVLLDRLSGKASKESVNYRPSRGADAIQMCAECSYFSGNDSSSCIRVAGVIEGSDVCDLFASKLQTGSQPDTQITINVSPGSYDTGRTESK